MYVPEIEISVKFKGKPNALKRTLQSSKAIHALSLEIFNADQIQWVEEFVMLSLNRQHEVIGFYKVSKGGMCSVVVDVRVIATVALQSLAQKVIVIHNHPSGNVKPSDADKSVTRRIKEALQLLDIELTDHLITSPDSYFSFSDSGLI